MTQNSQHSRFLSAPVGQMPIPLLPLCRIPTADSVVQELAGSVVAGMHACLLGWGLQGVFSLLGSQLTCEVTVVTLCVGFAALIPFVLGCSFTDASADDDDGERWYAAVCCTAKMQILTKYFWSRTSTLVHLYTWNKTKHLIKVLFPVADHLTCSVGKISCSK